MYRVLRCRASNAALLLYVPLASDMHVLGQQSSNVLRYKGYEYVLRNSTAVRSSESCFPSKVNCYGHEASRVNNKPRKRSPRRQGPIESLQPQSASYRAPGARNAVERERRVAECRAYSRSGAIKGFVESKRVFSNGRALGVVGCCLRLDSRSSFGVGVARHRRGQSCCADPVPRTIGAHIPVRSAKEGPIINNTS